MDLEQEIKNEEKEIEKTVKKSFLAKPTFHSLAGLIVIAGLLAGFIYWRSVAGQVYTDNASISVPIINLAPVTMGTLEETYVKVGDKVSPYTPVAKVGDEIITTKTGGIISYVSNAPGQVFMPGATVVSMLNTEEERLIGEVDEDKGLAQIKIGDPALFTIDAFGSKKFEGVVDEISETSHEGDIVFNISDKREEKQFDVKIKFDVSKYPELKNGMSGRLNIFLVK